MATSNHLPSALPALYDMSSWTVHFQQAEQVGSTLVVMKGKALIGETQPNYVAEYYNYQPFGEVIQSWGNYPTAFKFSSKEHDLHGGFNFDYFGARYYDPRIGQFASIDKAGQFASGYVYGGNNPIMGVDPDGNLFGIPILLAQLAIKAAIAVAPAAFTGAVTSAATYTAFNADNGWTWKGMLQSAKFGAVGGAAGAAAGGLGGVTSKALGGNAKLSSVRGVFGTAVGSGVSNMAIAAAQGASGGDLWKFGVSGFATGAVGASGAFGLAKHGMAGRLGYQALTTLTRSVGDNLAQGSPKPFDNIMIGLGPVNFRIGKGQKLINYRDNQYTIWHNAIGLVNTLGPGDSRISFDKGSLSFNYSGGMIGSLYSLAGMPSATGAFAMYDVTSAENAEYKNQYGVSLFDHEGTHIWQSRAMGDLFYPSYLYNLAVGYSNNHWEVQADDAF